MTDLAPTGPLPLVPDFGDEFLTGDWACLLETAREQEGLTLVPVTTGLPVRQWLTRLRAEEAQWKAVGDSLPEPYGSALVALATGVAFADLAGLALLVNAFPTGTPSIFDHLARGVCRADPACPVRDVMGWALVAGTLEPSASKVGARAGAVARAWRAVGLGQGGWLYAAAGLTPDEARAGLDSGALTEADARALAALRGVPLPA